MCHARDKDALRKGHVDELLAQLIQNSSQTSRAATERDRSRQWSTDAHTGPTEPRESTMLSNWFTGNP